MLRLLGGGKGNLRKRFGKVVEADLGRLSDPDLATSTVAYVLGEGDERVLLGLSQARSQAQQDLMRDYFSTDRKNDPVYARHVLLALSEDWDAAFVARYIRVLTTVEPPTSFTPGLSTTQPEVRILFEEVLNGNPLYYKQRNEYLSAVAKGKATGLDRLMEAALLLGTVDDVFDILFGGNNYYWTCDQFFIAWDVNSAIQTHLDRIPSLMDRAGADARTRIVEMIATSPFATTHEGQTILLSALGDGSKKVRTAAVTALKTQDADLVVSGVRDHLMTGSPAVRAAAAAVLAAHADHPQSRPALEERLSVEKSAAVIRAIEQALETDQAGAHAADDETGYRAIDGTRVEIPPAPPVPPREPIETFTRADLQALQSALEEDEAEAAEREKRWAETYGHPLPKKAKGSRADRDARWLVDHLSSDMLLQESKKALGNEDGSDTDIRFQHLSRGRRAVRVAKGLVQRLPLRQRLELAIAGNLMHYLKRIVAAYGNEIFADQLTDWLRSDSGDLRTLYDLVRELGIEKQGRVRAYGVGRSLTSVKPGSFMDDFCGYATPLHPADHWPYIATHIERVVPLLQRVDTYDEAGRRTALRVLGGLPKMPAQARQSLLDIALGGRGEDARTAAASLRGAEGLEAELVGFLSDGRQGHRAGAARLLGDFGLAGAVPALKARLKKEKAEVAIAAIITALRDLGESVADRFTPEAFRKDAAAGLKKQKADALDWLQLDKIGPLTLTSGETLHPDVPKWWVVLATKLKQPAGSALFDLWLDAVRAEDRDRFCLALFDAWVAKDTRRASEEEARATAKTIADSIAHYSAGGRYEFDYDTTYEEMLREARAAIVDSAAAFKGILGLAKRAPAPLLARRSRAYLKDHGSRVAQAKSVLEMLAATGEPVALQVVIATATRLKQKSVQRFAGELVEEAATRRGWSPDELADRTIPQCGLESDGTLALTVAEDKTYTARLADDATLQLLSPEGKPVKALPAGKDPETKAAKKALTAAKKEIKETLALQSSRLYEAMCVGRGWSLADFTANLREHPLMRPATDKMVFLAEAEGQPPVSFRPTPEGTFVDTDDADVSLTDDRLITIAHPILLGEDASAAWRAHLEDYEITPFVDQFGREPLGRPTDAERRGTAIVEREGWLSDTFAIRGVLMKRGWSRGQTEDAAYFYEYIKSFPSAGLDAVIEFTGSFVPEEQYPAAVISLAFHAHSQGRRRSDALDLKEVPAIILSECRNDYREAAAAGSYDPDWERKGLYG